MTRAIGRFLRKIDASYNLVRDTVPPMGSSSVKEPLQLGYTTISSISCYADSTRVGIVYYAISTSADCKVPTFQLSTRQRVNVDTAEGRFPECFFLDKPSAGSKDTVVTLMIRLPHKANAKSLPLSPSSISVGLPSLPPGTVDRG